MELFQTLTDRTILTGNWTDASWGVHFYQKNGYKPVPADLKDKLSHRARRIVLCGATRRTSVAVGSGPGWLDVEECRTRPYRDGFTALLPRRVSVYPITTSALQRHLRPDT